VDETVRRQQPAAAARDLRLVVEGPAGPVPLRCEEALLQRLVHELVDNAVKYADGPDVRIRLSAPAGGPVGIEVATDGPAIPADERSRIFEPFERGDAAVARDDEGGAGLGLYLARQLAQELGARLELRAGDRPGTAFTVEIPDAI
jgi:signal transduction histidine kinase